MRIAGAQNGEGVLEKLAQETDAEEETDAGKDAEEAVRRRCKLGFDGTRDGVGGHSCQKEMEGRILKRTSAARVRPMAMATKSILMRPVVLEWRGLAMLTPYIWLLRLRFEAIEKPTYRGVR
jgi:hypothetical protein